jgi:hypothetical protein
VTGSRTSRRQLRVETRRALRALGETKLQLILAMIIAVGTGFWAWSFAATAFASPQRVVFPRQGQGTALLPACIADRAAEQLAGISGADAALQRVAETLVPDFADHCFIDLFQGSALIRRVQRNAGD